MSAARGETRLAGLDGVRALAVLLVVFYHLNLLGIGWIGVQLFFVLSGFLITRLLLDLSGRRRLLDYLKTFHGRRVLRIAPLYLLYLAVLLAALPWLAPAQASAVSGQWPYAATWTWNLLGMTRFHEKTYFLDHFWSLAVEEQFYLLWPLLLYAVPRTVLPRVLIGLVLAGPLLRAALGQFWPAASIADPATLPYAIAVCTLSQLDAFAIGGLLCFYGQRLAGVPHPSGVLLAALLLVLGAGMLVSGAGIAPQQAYGAWLTLGYPNTLPAQGQWLWGYSAINALSALLIALVVHAGLARRLLEHRAVAYLGRISYGVYVFHFPLAHLGSGLVYRLHDWTGAGLYACLLMYAAVYLVVLIALSALSYELYERHFLALKQRYFPVRGAAHAS